MTSVEASSVCSSADTAELLKLDIFKWRGKGCGLSEVDLTKELQQYLETAVVYSNAAIPVSDDCCLTGSLLSLHIHLLSTLQKYLSCRQKNSGKVRRGLRFQPPCSSRICQEWGSELGLWGLEDEREPVRGKRWLTVSRFVLSRWQVEW